MRFLTDEQAREWMRGGEPPRLDDRGFPRHKPPGFHALQFAFAREAAPRLFWLSQCIEVALEPWDSCLLWVTQSGVWGSSENLHLYNRLRQSYGDLRHLEEAPGHLALRHEQFDVITFLQVSMMNGWDAYLFTSNDYGRAFVSHDEYGEIALPKHLELEPVRKQLEAGKLNVKVLDPAV